MVPWRTPDKAIKISDLRLLKLKNYVLKLMMNSTRNIHMFFRTNIHTHKTCIHTDIMTKFWDFKTSLLYLKVYESQKKLP